jgi:hypothetical protein
MSTTIESLELEIISNSKSAVDGIDALTGSLTKLRSATKNITGLSKLSKDIAKFNKTIKDATNNNKKSAASFTDFFNKIKAGVTIVKGAGNALGTVIQKSAEYTENMNLFTVSMGQYAGEANEYAETVSAAMGIDTSEWVRAQGIFMTMSTGFGVASDRAYTMSKNLTQLGYDLSSFYNIDVETAMLKLKSGLAGELEPLRAIGYDLSQAKLEATALALGVDKSVSSMTQAEKAQLRYYAIMTQVTDAQGDMARTLDDPANQMRVFKAEVSMVAREIGNIFIPALNAIIPYAIAVARVVKTIAGNIATLFGFKPNEITETTGTVVENTDAVQENLEGAQKEAKKLKSYLLGIDELNVINPNSGTANDDPMGELNFKLPEYDFMAGLVETEVNKIVNSIQGALDEIGMIVSGATLALGAVLAFTGVNVPLGVSLMAIGGYSLVTQLALNWGSMEDPLKTTLGIIGGIVGGGLLALGGILAFSGVNVPLGIALLAIGAVSLVTAVALNWDSLSQPVSETLGTIAGIAGASLLGIGAILAFSGGNVPLGIALMATGAITLVSAAALNWENLPTDLNSIITSIGTIVGGALLVVGAVLAFSGASVPLGLALMATGALSMGTAIALNTNLLSDDVKRVIAVITGAVSVALLAVGAILAFTGVNVPLGIALMAGGALALATAVVPNWKYIEDALRGPVGVVTGIVSGALLALGALLTFTGFNLPLGIALMGAGAVGLVTTMAVNWDSIKNALEGPIGGITALVGGAMLALGAILTFSSVAIPLGIGLMLAGAAGLATAVVINWNSIVEALRGPVGTITAIVSGALLVLGAILLFTGVGIPLGIGLMVAGAAGLASVVAVNWNFLTDKVKEIWGKIKDFWNTNIAPIFTAKWWKDLGKTCINGLIGGFEGGINGIIGAFENMINWVVDGLNSLSFDVPEWLGGGTWGINLPRASFGRVSIPRLAEGGFPETGQMFIAREAGAEMVGSIGRKTAVANNDQIVSGIAGGVAQANEEQNVLLREQNSLLRAILEKDSGVYLDGKNLTDSVEKYQRERGRNLIVGGVI